MRGASSRPRVLLLFIEDPGEAALAAGMLSSSDEAVRQLGPGAAAQPAMGAEILMVTNHLSSSFHLDGVEVVRIEPDPAAAPAARLESLRRAIDEYRALRPGDPAPRPPPASSVPPFHGRDHTALSNYLHQRAVARTGTPRSTPASPAPTSIEHDPEEDDEPPTVRERPPTR